MAEVLNHDVAGLHSRINRFIEELVKSVSSSGSNMNEYDIKRLASYLSAIRSYHDWIVSQPLLDLPETNPRVVVLRADPQIPQVESEIVQDVARLLEIARDELTSSQSARQSSGMTPHDSRRLLAVVEKVENFIVQYIEKVSPLDLPESSPMAPISGPGRTGI